MPTYYDVLGVREDASPDEIRAAHRLLARRLHPDARLAGSAAGGDGIGDMATLNEAWRVLSDPGRRAMYDASLRPAASVVGGPPAPAPDRTPPDVHRPLAPGSGHFPKWPFVLLFIVAAIFIVTAGALHKPGKPTAPDNLLFAGSCVTLLGNGDVAEVGCEGPHDAVVVTVVNFDATCPMETETHRDQQGRGYACVTRVAPTP